MQTSERKRQYDRDYYARNREELLEKKKVYERQQYELEKQRAVAEKAALDRMMQREMEKPPAPARVKKEEPPTWPASWFGQWLQAHGMTTEQGLFAVGADRRTWEALLRGEKTVPGIALIIGNLLGMTPEEVRQIGITPDAASRRSECFAGCPWHIDAAWWERVRDFPGQKEADLLWGRSKMRYSMERHPNAEHEKPRIPWSTFKPEEQEPINEGDRIYRDGTTIVKNRCLICDQLFIGSPSKKYCSVGCRSAAQIRMRTGEIVGPQTEEEREARKRANKNRWRRKARAMGKKV
ncbi:MAG: hypothetical protein IKN04_08000 [Clostridia bacterium]|nr:hypothetical protein [Clostridia bacterium]